MTSYVPQEGDFIAVTFDPQSELRPLPAEFEAQENLLAILLFLRLRSR